MLCAHLCNLVGQPGLGLSQDAGLGVVVALPGQVAGRAVAQPDKDGCHGMLDVLLTSLQQVHQRALAPGMVSSSSHFITHEEKPVQGSMPGLHTLCNYARL